MGLVGVEPARCRYEDGCMGLRRIVDVGHYHVGARSTVGAADSQVLESDAAMVDLLVPDLGSLGAQVVVVLRNHGVVVVIELYFGML